MTPKTQTALYTSYVIALIFVLGSAIYCRETFFKSDANEGLHLWLTIFSGNWSAEENGIYSNRSLHFTVASVAAIIVNFGPYVALFQFARSLTRLGEDKFVYQIKDLLRERDRAIKNNILLRFKDEVAEPISREQAIDIINAGFIEGNNAWDRQIDIVEPNKERANLLREKIRSAVIAPEP